jgi:hypothetical protein
MAKRNEYSIFYAPQLVIYKIQRVKELLSTACVFREPLSVREKSKNPIMTARHPREDELEESNQC